jgi:alpha-L-rhamnosidase
VAYNLWKQHNGTAALAYSWPGLRLYWQMLANDTGPYTIANGSSTFGRWGDWNPAYPEPRDPAGRGPPFTMTVSHITAATMVVQNRMEAAEMSLALGHVRQAEEHAAMIPVLKSQYHTAFFDPMGSVYGDGTITAMGCALWLELTPPELLPAVIENFVALLASSQYRMIGMGFIGVRYVYEALAKVNRTDVALRMLHARDYPSESYS